MMGMEGGVEGSLSLLFHARVTTTAAAYGQHNILESAKA
jgi:hypothetical protein